MTLRNKPEYLYLHVPFCRSICGYCDFAHSVYQEANADRWLKGIEKEIAGREINPKLQTIYIGGGTPTALTAKQLDTLLTLLDPYRAEVKEYTIEINPETLDEEKAKILVRHGVNRASIGFQTADQKLLDLMMRRHSAEDVRKTMDLLREHGIDNISLDLMYSLPQQTMDSLKESLAAAVSMNPTHLSLYSLTIEENTVFAKRGYEHLDEDTETDMYEYICQELPKHDFVQYEVSNFAREGKISMHNSAYWNYRDFYGIGPGASGKEDHHRYDTPRGLSEYLEDPMKKNIIPLQKEDEMFEMLMMGLRFKDGVDMNLFHQTFNIDFCDVYAHKAAPLIRKGLVEYRNDHYRCTDAGYEIMNSVLVELM